LFLNVSNSKLEPALSLFYKEQWISFNISISVKHESQKVDSGNLFSMFNILRCLLG